MLNIQLNRFKNKLSLDLCYSAIAKFFNIILVFLSSVLLARYLEPIEYGDYLLAISLINLLTIISCAGIPMFTTREVAICNQLKQDSIMSSMLVQLNFIATFISFFVAFFFAAIFLLFFCYKQKNYALVLLYCLPLVPLYSLSSIKVAAIKGKKKILDSVILELAIKPFIFFIVILLLLISDKFDVTSIVFGNICSALIYFILTDMILKKRIKILSINTFTCKKKELIKKILPFSGISIASFINIELITLLLGYISGSKEVAFLKCANNLSLIVALPLNIIELSLSPYITSLYYSDNKINLQKIIIIISFLALISSLFPVVILLAFGEKIIIFLYGYEYISACNELFILALSYLIVNTIGISMQLLYATKYHIEAFRISIYGSVATIILCLTMIPWLGGTGAAIALGGGKIFRAVFFSFKAKKLLNIKTSIFF